MQTPSRVNASTTRMNSPCDRAAESHAVISLGCHADMEWLHDFRAQG